MFCSFTDDRISNQIFTKLRKKIRQHIRIVSIVFHIVIGNEYIAYFNFVSYFYNRLDKCIFRYYNRFFIHNGSSKTSSQTSCNRSRVFVFIKIRKNCNFCKNTDVHRCSNSICILGKSAIIPCQDLSFFESISYFQICNKLRFNVETTSRVFLLSSIGRECFSCTIYIFDDIEIIYLIDYFTFLLCSHTEFFSHVVRNGFFNLITYKNGTRISCKHHVLRLLIRHRSTMRIIMQCTRRRQKFRRAHEIYIRLFFNGIMILRFDITTSRCNSRIQCELSLNTDVSIRRC